MTSLPEQKIEAIIFDMDGVLVNTENVWGDALVKVFGKYGLQITRKEAAMSRGLKAIEAIVWWQQHPDWKVRVAPEQVRDELNAEVFELYPNIGPMAGAVELVRRAKALGLATAIGSSSPYRAIEIVVQSLGIGDAIDAIHSSQDEPYGKPFPGVFQNAAKKIGVEPRACIVVEDSPYGVLAAKSALMKCIAVPDAQAADAKEIALADYVVSSLTQVTDDMLR